MDTENTVRHFVAHRLGISDEEVALDVDLRSLPQFDSIHALQIVLDVEEHFDVEVEDHVVFEVRTVREFAAVIHQIVAAQADSAVTS
ncbi:acyl carrier protein [Streptomyces sp. ISID311]|uniref:acyl carrier protein n=1 Tax=Streptomyces TaxID=1883 RepID=UPI0021C385BC|nr:acyl carrier protein [Streptomyces sp. ISID311]